MKKHANSLIITYKGFKKPKIVWQETKTLLLIDKTLITPAIKKDLISKIKNLPPTDISK